MPREAVPVIVDVSLASSDRNYDTTVDFLEKPFRIVRIGTDGDVDRAEELIKEWTDTASVFAITGARDARTVGILSGDERAALRRLESATGDTPTTNGHRLRDVLQEWTVRKVAAERSGLFSNARTVVLGGSNHRRTARVLRESTENIKFADAILTYGLPSMLDFDALERFLGVSKWMLDKVPDVIAAPVTAPGRRFNQSMLRRAVVEADVLVATYDELMMFHLEELAGKTLITSSVSDERLEELNHRGVDLVLDDTPQPFPDVTINAAVLEALMLAATGAEESSLTDDDLLDMITSADLQPRELYPGGYKRKSRFAFVIHPLSQEYLRNVEPLNTISKVAPQVVMDGVEKAIAYAPAFKYSHVTGIVSPTGDEAEGLADHRRRNAEAAARARPGIHLQAAAAGCRHRQETRGPDHGSGSVHEGRRRCRGDGGQARTAAHHDRQQLQCVGSFVGPARRDPPAGRLRGRRARPAARQGHGGGGDRCDRLGVRATARDGL
ncbi:MAG: hypothetical protein V9G10_04540 [Candidatus Nanopelagicales bacterium]